MVQRVLKVVGLIGVILLIGHLFGSDYAIGSYLSANLFLSFWGRGGIKRVAKVYSQVGVLAVVEAIALATIVGTVAVALYMIPLLRWSWLGWLRGQGSGPGSVLSTTLRMRGWGLLFTALFVLAIPSVATAEEKIFRYGTLGWLPTRYTKITGGSLKDNLSLRWWLLGGLGRSLVFGLAHCIMGVPLAAALAIGLSGAWFTHKYMKGGLEKSIVCHSTYNLIIAIVVLVGQIMSLF